MKNGIRLTLTWISVIGAVFLTGISDPVNAQVLSNIEKSELHYKAGDPAIQITNSIRVDGRNLISAEIRITEGYNADEDILVFRGSKSLSASWDKANGALNLYGYVSASTYRDALRQVYFENTNALNPSTALRTVSFSVSSFYNKSNTVSRKIFVETNNTPPILGNVPTDPIVYCMDSEGEIISNTISVTDNDNLSLKSANIAITLGYSADYDILLFTDQNGISGSWNSSSGQLTLSGESSVSNYQEALRSIRFQNKDPQNPHAGLHEITFTVYDGIDWSNSVLRNITHPVPTAVLTGNASICRGNFTALEVTFTGSGPYSFSYTRNSGTPVEVNDITSATYNFPVGDPGTYSLESVSDKYCPGKYSGTAQVNLLPEPDVEISELKPAYSKESVEMIELTAEPPGGVFSGPGVIPYAQGWYFLPSLPPPGITNIVYKYRANEASCYGYDTASVRILEKSAAIETENDRTKFCINDKPFTVTGINLLSNSKGYFTISGGKGIIDHGNNTATIYPDSLSINGYTISYTPPDGFPTYIDIEIGGPLKADFKWNMECFEPGTEVSFTNTSTSPFGFLTSNSYDWTITRESDSLTFRTRDVDYQFQGPGNYKVKLHLSNSNGCVNEITRVFPLRPVFAISGNNYTEDFEGEQEWETGFNPAEGMNSWVLGKPDGLINGFSNPYSGENCWFTNTTVNPVPHENSWITSPCFDFSGTEKPTLVARIRRSFTDTRDGANITYSVDNGATWNLVGNLHDGINWFNGYFGNPGSQSQGWTAVMDNEWVETRHVLDFLKGERTVQFRVNYFANGSAIGNKGIALDDFKIVERNRTILIEHFTNISDNASRADDILEDVAHTAGSGLIDLHYHAADPQDPFYNYNPILSDARQFYYGLIRIPYSIINGGTNNSQHIDYINTVITNSQVGIESLYDSDFDLDVKMFSEVDRLYVEAVITALHDVPLNELSLRIVVYEPVIVDSTIADERSSYRNVVRTMLPDAAGTGIYRSWQKGESFRIVESWDIKEVYNKEGLKAAAFIQNELNREIQQAALGEIGVFNDTEGNQASTLIAYPNPVSDMLHMNFSMPQSRYLVEIYNSQGKLIYSRQVTSENHAVSLRHVPAGICILRVTDSEGRSTSHKIQVSH